MSQFSIIIPTRNTYNIACNLQAIQSKDPNSLSRVIVVDDEQDGGVEGVCDALKVRRVLGIQPFIFSRNINLGIAAAGDDDVILCNDDTGLFSDFGFGYLSVIANENPQFGIISAAITGAVGNTEQLAQAGTRLREAKHHTVVFVCVYIRRQVLWDLVTAYGDLEKEGFLNNGRYEWLDERFIGYGYDDDDMCERVRRLGLKLGVFDGCVVEHGVLPSSYRGHAGMMATDLKPNRDRFIEKWGFEPGRGPHAR